MGEKYTREQYEADLAARQEREAREAQEARERMEKATLKREWLADGGSEAAFEKAYPDLRDEARRKRVVDADRQARAMMQASNVSQI